MVQVGKPLRPIRFTAAKDADFGSHFKMFEL